MSSRQEDHNAEAARVRLWSPIFIIILLCTLSAFLVGQGSNAGTTVYLDRVGGTTSLAGIGALCFSVSAALARILSGPVIDGRGRRLVMVAGAAVMVAGTLGPLLANEGAAFIAWRALQGMGFSAVTTATATAAADVVPAERLGEGVGYYGLGQAVSMSIGPALAIWLASSDAPANLYAGLTIPAALALAFALICRYEAHPDRLPLTAEYRMRWDAARQSAATSLEPDGDATAVMAEARQPEERRDDAGSPAAGGFAHRLIDGVFEPKALRGTIPITVISAMFSFSIFYMGVFGTQLGVAGAGSFYVVSAIVMIAIRLISGHFMDTAAPLRIMGVAVLCGLVAYALALGCALGAFGDATAVVFALMGAPYGVSIGLAIPVNQTVAVRNSPPERWGAANGLFMLGVDVSNAVAATLWGFLSEAAGFAVCIVGVMAFCAASYAAARLCYPSPV